MASTYYDSVGKTVNDGDVIYAADLNTINSAVDTALQQVEVDISTVAVNQSFYSDLAQKWAENTEDTEVEPGSYSALHWAAKSEDHAIDASAQVGLAAAQVGLATTQAGLATTQAGIATTQAGIATTQAGTATTQAGIATTQAGIATTKAGEASDNAAASLASEVAAEASALEAATYINGKIDYVVDGDFNSWLDGTSHSTSGYGSATMWGIAKTLSTLTLSRQDFTIGQVDVPGGNTYYARSVVSDSGGISFAGIYNIIEGVKTLANKDITLSFYAKADASKPMGFYLLQSFGTGGSSGVSFGKTLVNLTTSWTKFDITINAPSISGKTIAGGNDGLYIYFIFDDYDAAPIIPGMSGQSGTFDIARVRLVEGSRDGDSIQHTVAEDALMVSRYYQVGFGSIFSGNITNGSTYAVSTPFQGIMRGVPEITVANALNSSFPATTGIITAHGNNYVESRVASATVSAGYYGSTYKLNARL